MAEKLIVEGHLTKVVEETKLSKGSFSVGFLWCFSVCFYNSWIVKVSVHFQGHSTLTINLCLTAHSPVDNNIKQLEFWLKDVFIGRFLFKWVYVWGVFLMLGIGFVSY